MRDFMHLTEKQLGGWSLLVGTAAVAVGYALSPGRGAVDTVPSTSLTDLTLAMARNEALAYTVPIVIIFGAMLMLNGLLTLRRYAGPVPRLGLMAMAIALIIQMVMRGFDYMIVGMGVAAHGERRGGGRGMAPIGAGDATDGLRFALHLECCRIRRGSNHGAGPRFPA